MATWLIQMYLAATLGNPCQANQLAYQDFMASGACTWDPQTEDGECTEVADQTLLTLFTACQASSEGRE